MIKRFHVRSWGNLEIPALNVGSNGIVLQRSWDGDKLVEFFARAVIFVWRQVLVRKPVLSRKVSSFDSCGYGRDYTAAPAVWLWQLLLLPSLSSRISSILRVVDSTNAYEMVVAIFATASLLYAAKKVSWRPRRMILEHRVFWEAEEDETEEEEDGELWVGVRRWARKARRNIKKAALETGFSFQSCQLRGGRWWKTLRVAWTVSLNLWFIPALQLLMSGISQATMEKALSLWGQGRKDLRYVCFATISEALSLDR